MLTNGCGRAFERLFTLVALPPPSAAIQRNVSHEPLGPKKWLILTVNPTLKVCPHPRTLWRLRIPMHLAAIPLPMGIPEVNSFHGSGALARVVRRD